VNDNDAQLTDLITAQSGSTVENTAPNAPGQPGFDLVIEAVAGSAIGNTGAPYTLTVSVMDLTAVAPANLVPPIPPQFFNAATGWNVSGPEFEYSQTFPVTIPLTGGPGSSRQYVGHTLQYTASLVNQNAQIVSILESEPFVLV
jgi:hypothetical protein